MKHTNFKEAPPGRNAPRPWDGRPEGAPPGPGKEGCLIGPPPIGFPSSPAFSVSAPSSASARRHCHRCITAQVRLRFVKRGWLLHLFSTCSSSPLARYSTTRSSVSAHAWAISTCIWVPLRHLHAVMDGGGSDSALQRGGVIHNR